MAKKKNTLKDLNEFLQANQDEENTNPEEDFHEKDPTQLVEVEPVNVASESAKVYQGKKKVSLTSEADIYQAILDLASTRKVSPETILSRIIEMREEELGIQPEASFTDWLSDNASAMWRQLFD